MLNIGGKSERTNLQVVQAICAIIDQLRPPLVHVPCSPRITFVEDRLHNRRYAMDFSKIQRELGREPIESFELGLTRTVQWHLQNSQRAKQNQSHLPLGTTGAVCQDVLI